MHDRIRVGNADALMAKGQLTGKLGSQPVCVFWADGRAYAVDDRCPHMGFPLHRGTVENGLLTCHWHHARFDLESGGTLDPFADDVRSYPVAHRRQRRGRHRRARRRPCRPAAAPARRRPGAGADPRHRQSRPRPGRRHGPDGGRGRHRGAGVEFGTRYRAAGLGRRASRCSPAWPTCSTGWTRMTGCWPWSMG